jgi:hypothetical protein
MLTEGSISGGITVEPTSLAELVCAQRLAILNGSTVNRGVTSGGLSGLVTGIHPDTFSLTHN